MRTTEVNLSERAIAHALSECAARVADNGLDPDDVQTLVELGRALLDFQQLHEWITAPLDDEDLFQEAINREPSGELVPAKAPVHRVTEPIRVETKPTYGDAVKIAMPAESAIRAVGKITNSKEKMGLAGNLLPSYVESLRVWLAQERGCKIGQLGHDGHTVTDLREIITKASVNGQLVIPK